jgi:hypothetical protein
LTTFLAKQIWYQLKMGYYFSNIVQIVLFLPRYWKTFSYGVIVIWQTHHLCHHISMKRQISEYTLQMLSFFINEIKQNKKTNSWWKKILKYFLESEINFFFLRELQCLRNNPGLLFAKIFVPMFICSIYSGCFFNVRQTGDIQSNIFVWCFCFSLLAKH